MEERIKIVIADDHPAILFGARYVLSSCADLELVGEARRSTGLIPLLEQTPCDVLVTDLAMPGGEYGDGLPLLSLIRRRFPLVRIVVLTMLENPGLLKRIRELGVLGVVSKRDDLAHIGSAVRRVMRDGVYIGPAVQQSFDTVGMAPQQHALTAVLSKREFEVVRLYVAGSTIKEIALALSRSIKTISTQKSAAMRKLGVERDSDLHQYALSHGLANVSLPGEEPIAARYRAHRGSPSIAGTDPGVDNNPEPDAESDPGRASRRRR